MNRTRIFIALLAAGAVFTSCKRSYTCRCMKDNSNSKQNFAPYYDKEIKTKDYAEAEVICNALDSACTIRKDR